MTAPLPPDEPARLAALHQLNVLDTLPEQEYDDLTRLAAAICGTPISAVSLIDADRQWFKSCVGLVATQTPRDVAFCAHAIRRPDLFEVPDATADERFAANPFVTGDPRIRFYAGMPLVDADGFALGTLCVIDRTPRTLTAAQRDALRVLARQVVAHLALRQRVAEIEGERAERERAEAALRDREERFRGAFDHAPIGMALVAPDGRWLKVNRALSDILGYPPDELLATDFQTLTHPDDLGADLDLVRRTLAGEIDSYQMEKRYLHKGGAAVHAVLAVSLVRGGGGRPLYFIAHVKDVTARRRAEEELRESEARFRAFMDNSPALAFVKDADGRYVYVNGPVCERFGIPREGWLGRTDADLWAPEVAAALRRIDVRVLAGDETVKVLENAPTPDGGGQHWQSYKFPLTDAAGRRFLAGMAVDVTAEKRAEGALRASEAKFRATLDRLAEGVYLVDPPTGRFVEANAEFAALGTADVVAREPADAVARTVAAVHEALARDGRCDLGRRHLRRKDGTVVPVDVRVTAVPDGGAGLHAVVVRDMTEQLAHEEQVFAYQQELERANAQLREQATTDRLTGVKNRGAFNDRLAEESARAGRSAAPLSVVLLDVDHFKAFNDTFGHPAGDAVLQAVAGALRQTVRGTDFVARYGGEEFAVILPDTDYAGAMVLAERLRRAVAAVAWDKRPVTISVGVATRAPGATDGSALVQEADDALYRSKRAGRNRVSHGSNVIPQLAATRA